MDTASTVFASTDTLTDEIRGLLARLGLGQEELEKLLDPRVQVRLVGWTP